ncbi:hypothetical protein [Rubripirellula reticaptiva]|uniref:Uncharacterized protein n=1 Tax=Rubripirellula reticaptiva TaxID=2528013 RepID=A0A5C6F9S8_9BACT|nr:hypothetical protein [Rubripirellula reticaptiva]TWU58148.1 hypothetical protein Poly59_10570 [Rubripirellula reticaptiva]
MVWITRLALIAYLVGGWLLPASHFHAHSVAGCGSHAHSDAGPACGHSHDHSGHHFHANTVDDAEPGSFQQFAGGAIDQRAASDRCHDGLCAICAARSLSSTAVLAWQLPSSLDLSCREVWIADDWIASSDEAGGNWTRGPPEQA